MKVYLARHGEALTSEINPTNPLSEIGIQQIERIAKFLAKIDLRVSDIFHSEKKRAKQTAEIIASVVLNGTVKMHEGLDPLDPVEPLAYEIKQNKNDILYVGHMPFMGKLVSKLITNDESRDIVFFRTGSIICLERISSDWIINWFVSPELT